MKALSKLQELIIDWAKEKDLIKLENAPKQRLKLLEEVGETARAILKNDVKEIKDGLGDIFVVLVILQAQYSFKYDFEISFYETDCDLSEAFTEILECAKDDFSIDLSFQWLNEVCNITYYDLTECANLAWNEIKDRTGKNVNGTFIKDEAKY
jgi:NTP pyrophosphatase (non-canonical NTP hydrolase)